MENHHFQRENSLFLWPFSIAACNIRRGQALCPGTRFRSATAAVQGRTVGPGSPGNQLVPFANQTWKFHDRRVDVLFLPTGWLMKKSVEKEDKRGFRTYKQAFWGRWQFLQFTKRAPIFPRKGKYWSAMRIFVELTTETLLFNPICRGESMRSESIEISDMYHIFQDKPADSWQKKPFWMGYF